MARQAAKQALAELRVEPDVEPEAPKPEVVRASFTPNEGDLVTLELPGERTRATVSKLVSATRIVVELWAHTTGNKSHNYKKGDIVAAEYRKGPMNLMGWYLVPDHEL